MSLQVEIPKLIKHYEFKKARCFLNLNAITEKIMTLTKKSQQLISNEQALQMVLKSKKLSGHITLSKLHEFQRSEAVIKRKIADIRLQIKANSLEKEKLTTEAMEIKKKLRLCNFKFEKYVFLNKKMNLDLLHQQNSMEESIIEELTYGQGK